MQTIGFNFTKISAEKFQIKEQVVPNIKMEFTNVEKEAIDFLKDKEAVKVSFNFIINYEPPKKDEANKKKNKSSEKLGEVSFSGSLVFSCSDEEAKEFHKSWKNKQVPKQHTVPIYNFLLKKCSTKAFLLEEDLNLPLHMPFPQINPNQQQNASN